MAYPCLHSPKTTKETRSIRRIQRRPIRHIGDIVCEYSRRYQMWSLLQETPITSIQSLDTPIIMSRSYDEIPAKSKNDMHFEISLTALLSSVNLLAWQKARILELKQRYFEDYYSDNQYAISIKEDTAINMSRSYDEVPAKSKNDMHFEISCNSSFITLVPKCDDPLVLNDYMPISLIGCQYKIIAKILENRLGKVIASVAKMYKRKLFLLKVDFEKAFDTLSWSFLESVMCQMGFSLKWKGWILACLRSGYTSVLINGSPTPEFKLKRGLRQGNPLSPLLLILAVEALNVSLLDARKNNLFRGVEVGIDKIHISHLQYADDALIMGEWSLSNAKNFSTILSCFHLASGLKVNFNKSIFYRVGVSHLKLNYLALAIEFEKLEDLNDKDVSPTCGTSLEVFNKEFKRMSGMDNDLFTYEVEVANIPCDSNKDDDSEQRVSHEADDDTGYDSSDVAFTEWLGSKKFNCKTMDHYTKKALWIYWIRGNDEVELTDEESSDNKDEVAKAYLLRTLRDSRLMKNLRTTGFMNGTKTYHGWTRNLGLTHDWKSDGYCNGGNLPGAYIVENSLHYQDYEWYEALKDSELKEQALINKAILEGLISDDESSNDGWRRWESHEITYHNHDELEYENETHDERQELCEAHELPVCNMRRFKMIKYSFGQDEEYVAIKEDEYDDLARTSDDACQAYQEIFRMMDEGWMVTRAE
ncbi:C2 calcium/lipid-binding domain-containing protein CaLB [Tanacetum coccineum]|uniref:C2 calcium/lipid-binding domain-containing protein CaLB n=1 Tax=Tanacetum coccineum TaxID=301880 RepID=A0ABQ4XV86_9ASTR